MKKKNSLIELYRFIFAMNVVKNHGYFPYRGSYFSPGRISVEFFFVLSGLFLIRTIDKYRDYPFFKGLFVLIKDKLLSLGIPLVVGLIFNIAYKFVVGVDSFADIGIWGYLWYVHDMLMAFTFYYALRRLVKSEKAFLIVTAAVFVVATVLHIMPTFWSWGYFRSFSSMSAGVLVSYLPKYKPKRRFLALIPLFVAQAWALRMLLFGFVRVEEVLLDIVVYPALIYFSFNVEVHSSVLNYLGSLSFGLYAYQCVTRFLESVGFGNEWLYFIIILTLTVVTDLIKRLNKRRKELSRQTAAKGLI